MREIKFRAWDERIKRMINWNEICEGVFTFNDLKFDFVKWMQFTGLKDKNGKEIFEGDIIQSFYENEKEIGEVFWNINSASFDIKGDGWKSMENLQEANQYYEVIGNIYENPELLEETEPNKVRR